MRMLLWMSAVVLTDMDHPLKKICPVMGGAVCRSECMLAWHDGAKQTAPDGKEVPIWGCKVSEIVYELCVLNERYKLVTTPPRHERPSRNPDYPL